mmetsp:Transcript_107606/g.321811  ORF Transcript_107606/g.321811 Transcript_107606/m.321811 type:complete len:232 (+) Transcript_107606:145-840(+)
MAVTTSVTAGVSAVVALARLAMASLRPPLTTLQLPVFVTDTSGRPLTTSWPLPLQEPVTTAAEGSTMLAPSATTCTRSATRPLKSTEADPLARMWTAEACPSTTETSASPSTRSLSAPSRVSWPTRTELPWPEARSMASTEPLREPTRIRLPPIARTSLRTASTTRLPSPVAVTEVRGKSVDIWTVVSATQVPSRAVTLNSPSSTSVRMLSATFAYAKTFTSGQLSNFASV